MKRQRTPKTILAVGLLLFLILAGPARAEAPVLRTAPAQDCAVVTSMPGFPRMQASSLVEKEILMEGEGVVIRQSAVKDGKIVIPPAGLYYTVRTDYATLGFWRWPLANYPVLLLGKKYYLAATSHNYGVKRDFVVKKGEAIPYGLAMSALEFSQNETSWGPDSLYRAATFRVLKPSGNYFGASWAVTAGGPFARKAKDAVAGAQRPDDIFFQENPLTSTGTSYLILKDVDRKQATVAEWAFSEVRTVDLADQAVASDVAIGETMQVGQYRARVVSIDQALKTAQVALVDGSGATVAEKVLGPLTDKVLALLPSNDRDLESLLLKRDNVEVGLAAYNNPFGETGKVKLVGYVGTLQTTMGGVWKRIPGSSSITTPETSADC